MGRPPVGKFTGVRLPPEMLERIDAIAGPYKRAAFIRECVENELSKTDPCCPRCGSTDMTVGGFVTFHWAQGRLRPKKGSEELSEGGSPWICGGCGAAWHGNWEPPFDFEPAPATPNPKKGA